MAARLAPALVLAGVALVGAAGAASATGHHDKPATGHTPIVVCHNVTHNPHIIVVDDDSTKLRAHLAHRTQAELMDLVEGYDGTAAQIRAACVRPTTTPTTTPTEVPSSTPPTTQTHSPSPTTTDAPSPTSQPTSPSPTSSTPTTGGPRPVAPSSPTFRPSTSSRPPTASTAPSPTTAPSPRRSGPSSTVAPPKQLARTGSNTAALALLGAGLLAAGIAVSRKGARRGNH